LADFVIETSAVCTRPRGILVSSDTLLSRRRQNSSPSTHQNIRLDHWGTISNHWRSYKKAKYTHV